MIDTRVRRVASLLAVAAGLVHGVIALAQQPSFSTKIATVRVDVSVTQRGKVVPGLTAQDFEVRDNGVLQQVDLATSEQLPLNVHLALDLSHSVSGERLHDVKAAGQAVLDVMTPKDKALLLTFNHAVHLREPLTTNLGHVRSALEDAESFGDTALYDATYAAMVAGLADPGRDLMLVFSDGRDTASWLQAETVLETARSSDVVVYGLSVRGSRSSGFLGALGAATGGEAFEVATTSDLRARFLTILNGFRERYLVSYSPRGVARGGWHKLDVKIRGRAGMVRARPGYFDRDER